MEESGDGGLSMPTSVGQFTWFFMKKYKWSALLQIAATIVSQTVAFFICPFIYKMMIKSAGDHILTIEIGIKYALIFASMLIIPGSIFVVVKYVFVRGAFKASADATETIFFYCLNHKIEYFNERMGGDLSSKIKNIMQYFKTELLSNLKWMMAVAIIFFLGIFFIFKITRSVCLTIFNVVWLVFMCLIIGRILKISFKRHKINTENKNIASGIIVDCFTNVSNIKIFSSERKEFRTLRRQNSKILRSSMAIIETGDLKFITSFFLASLFIFTNLTVCLRLALNGQMPMDSFIFIAGYVANMAYWSRSITENFAELTKNISIVKNAMEVLLAPIGLKDRENATDIGEAKGKIVFKNVNFNYKGMKNAAE
ncbi:MAG: hypothetical protein LBB09_02935 [Rickettsiales bacterium]|jgi:ABC-type multidrug transport system fused ATPase/permease subunit|nr:hypothetical protein [Rickettsiales bacterium]